jgi:hypothetical protein
MSPDLLCFVAHFATGDTAKSLIKTISKNYPMSYELGGLIRWSLSTHPNLAATVAVFLWYSIKTGHLSSPLGDANHSL